MTEKWSGYTSIVRRIDDNIVRKTFKESYVWMVKREQEALKRLDKYKNFPKIISVTSEYIDMSYCGIQAKEFDRKQCSEILSDLKESRIVHRDVIPRNLLSKEGTIFLIDFGWCLFDGEKESPVIPPRGLGLHYYQNRAWDDQRAMKIILSEMGL